MLCQAGAGRSVEYLPILKWRDVRLPSWARPQDKFVLVEVCGDSLTGARIQSGDLALVHLTKEITLRKDLCAILVHGAILLKYVFIEPDGRVRLEGKNARYKPRFYEPNQIEIQGRVVRIEFDLL